MIAIGYLGHYSLCRRTWLIREESTLSSMILLRRDIAH